ncbi:HD phosphohydrolase superfamily [Gracilaria domingensis]|nr:HD phosphohydrolase superfamily [Gracilaria domingensis]
MSTLSTTSQPDGFEFIDSQTVAPCHARVKVINDPIHGHFELRDPILRVIDTPHFQRLRDLKQLGATYYVYPGASHNRFEHSIGVSHLSGSFVSKLYRNSRDPHAGMLYDGEEHFKHAQMLVQLAGLAHDLGHGPFSHMFDHVFLPAVAENNPQFRHSPLLKHEERSVLLFEHCVDAFNIDLTREDIRTVGQFIRGDKSAGTLTPRFLYDVVANSSTGIDTDKFDYLARDVYNVGLQGAYGFDHRRLINFAKVVEDNICFHRKEIFNVYHLFLTRYQFHRTVYNHRAALSIDAMVSDAFLHADSHLDISASIFDPEQFLTVTDSMTTIIERTKEPSMKHARDLIRRLRARKLYRFVEEDAAGTGVTLTPEDVYVAHVTLNFGMKDKNPVDRVLFFKDWDDMNPTHISSAKASYVLPAVFEEKIIRIFVTREETDDSNRVKKAVSVAFRNFMRRENLGSSLNSPVLTKRSRELAGLKGDSGGVEHIEPIANGLGESQASRVAKRCKPESSAG